LFQLQNKKRTLVKEEMREEAYMAIHLLFYWNKFTKRASAMGREVGM
jgi:hypothetical protein